MNKLDKQFSKKALVAIIITTKNEEDVLARLLESIKNQTYKNIKTVVVDNNSTDKTVEIAKKYTKSIYRYGPERSAQRNYGAKKSRGEYILFLDADMQLTKKVISECVKKAEENPKIGGIIIPEQSIANSFWEKVKAYERSFYNLSGDESVDAARFIRRKAFEKVGGYDESITGPEDWDLPENVKKKGYEIIRVKPLIYHYERVKNLFSLVRKKYYYGLRSSKYLEKHGISPISSKTIYFMRPVFYKNWKRLLGNPTMSVAMLIMFFFETLGGGLGYLKGKLNG